jgi:outer membrane lipoprotein SlyB
VDTKLSFFKIYRVAFSLVLTLTSTSILGGCVTDIEKNPKQTVGRILGAGLGALTGSQIGSGKGQMVSVAVGALAGAWLGGEIGGSLDKRQHKRSKRRMVNIAENLNKQSTWMVKKKLRRVGLAVRQMALGRL